MEPTGEAKERETSAHLETHKNGVKWSEAKGTAQNRVMWRALFGNLCST